MFLLRLEPSKAWPLRPALRVLVPILIWRGLNSGLVCIERIPLWTILNLLSVFTENNTRIYSYPYSFVCAHTRVKENEQSLPGCRYRKDDQGTRAVFGVLEVYRNRHAKQDQDKHIEEYCASGPPKIPHLNYLTEPLY